MSRTSDLFVAIGRGHQDSLTVWANKYKVPLPTGGAWKDRVKWATDYVNHKKEASMASTKQAPKASPKSKKVENEEEEDEEEETPKTKKQAKEEKTNTLGSKEVADMLGVKPAALRRWLRAKGHNTEGEYARYEWEKDSPRLAKLIKDFKASQAEKSRADNLKKGKEGKGKAAPKKNKNEDVEEEEEEEEIDEME